MRLAIRTSRLELSGRDRDGRLEFAVVQRTDGADVGRCALCPAADADGVMELEWSFHRGGGAGLADEALEAIVGYAFTRDEIVSVRARARAGDTAARGLLERAGMMAVGEREGWVSFEA